MLQVHFTAQDLMRVGFASQPAPLMELGLAAAALQRRDCQGVFGRWRADRRRGLPSAALPCFASSRPTAQDRCFSTLSATRSRTGLTASGPPLASWSSGSYGRLSGLPAAHAVGTGPGSPGPAGLVGLGGCPPGRSSSPAERALGPDAGQLLRRSGLERSAAGRPGCRRGVGQPLPRLAVVRHDLADRLGPRLGDDSDRRGPHPDAVLRMDGSAACRLRHRRPVAPGCGSRPSRRSQAFLRSFPSAEPGPAEQAHLGLARQGPVR